MISVSKQHKWNIAFWTVQLLGWGGLMIFSYQFTPDFDGFKGSSIFKLLLLVSFLSGVISTSLLRFYLKRSLSLDSFGLRELSKITVGILVASAIYYLMNFSAGSFEGFYPKDEVKIPEIYRLDFNRVLAVFSSILTIVAWTVFYMAVKIVFKLNKDRLERSELDATLRQAQLNTLKGQINPHFMFNSLNNIRGLMLEDVEKSREMLTKLSEMLRYSLTKNDVNAIALEEELEMVDNYIDLAKIQLEDRLTFSKDIAPESLGTAIPPMIVQLLVENAVKHGISNLKKGGKIVVQVKHLANTICIKVFNTGKLQIAKQSTQLGLKNIKQRLRLLYGQRATFTLKEKAGEVEATIRIPLK